MVLQGPHDAPAQTPMVRDTTVATFRNDVLAPSLKQVVLVDFWAPWCGPCKQLGPILERAVAATKGKVALCKMNIDEEPEIAGQLGVKSIPAIIAFKGGKPVDGFVGALPESQIKTFIERLVGPGEASASVQQASDALDAHDFEKALALIEPIVQSDPSDASAVAVFLRALIGVGEIEEASQIYAGLPKELAEDAKLAQVAAALKLAAQAKDVGDDAPLRKILENNPNDRQARFDLALVLNAKGERDGASDALLHIIKHDRAWNDDSARKQLLQFFESWGPLDPATKSARRKLSSFLYS